LCTANEGGWEAKTRPATLEAGLTVCVDGASEAIGNANSERAACEAINALGLRGASQATRQADTSGTAREARKTVFLSAVTEIR
jgi:hypothetical protein